MNKVVVDFIKELGYDISIIDDEQEKRVKRWLEVYKGKTKAHTYYLYNGAKKIKKELKTLGIATQSCEDLSDFFFNEKLEISFDNKKVEKKIIEVLNGNNFLENSNKMMQLIKALGTGAYVTYLEKDILKINYMDATGIIILDADKTGIKSVLLYSESANNITLNAHILKENGYVIYNRKYKLQENNFVEEEIEEELKEIETQSFLPRFAVIRNTSVNNFDINSPYGISCFANSADVLLSIDNDYDALFNEVNAGRKRLFVKSGAVQFNINSKGETTPVFDETDTTYYQVPGGEKDPLVTESNGQLRIEQITASLQANLNLYTSKIGLGHNYYKFLNGQAYVNTDNIISANSDVYRKIKKQENIITSAIVDLVYAIAEQLKIKEKFSVSVNYDDSIIEDTQQTRLQAQSEYNNKLISKSQYYRNVYKMNDATAKKFVEKMNKEIKEETIIDGSEFDINE